MSTTNDATYAHSAEAKHIVSMNERLLTETQKLREDLKEAETQRDSFEEEIGRMEQTHTVQRGLLQNFVAIKEAHEKISSSQNHEISAKNEIFQRKEAYIRKHEYASTANFIAMAFCFFTDKFSYLNHSTFLLSCFMILGMSTYYLRKQRLDVEKACSFYQKQVVKNQKVVTTTSEELKKIIDACDVWSEYVNSV